MKGQEKKRKEKEYLVEEKSGEKGKVDGKKKKLRWTPQKFSFEIREKIDFVQKYLILKLLFNFISIFETINKIFFW